MSKVPRLTGQALADAYAATYRHLGKVWASYDGGGWITLRGEKLKPHPSMAAQYPNGWSLMDRVRTSKARERIRQAAR